MALGRLGVALGVQIQEKSEAIEQAATQQVSSDNIALLFELVERIEISKSDRFDDTLVAAVDVDVPLRQGGLNLLLFVRATSHFL